MQRQHVILKRMYIFFGVKLKSAKPVLCYVYRYCTSIFLFHKKEQIVTFDRYLKFRGSIALHEITICSFYV